MYLSFAIAILLTTIRDGASEHEINVDIRLAGGNDTAGRVEVLYNGQWGTICDDYWGMLDAEVVCRQLNLGNPLAFTKKAVPFGKGNGSVLLDNVACDGSELNIAQCRHRGFNVHNCDHNEDAGVVCSGILVTEKNWVLGKDVVRGPDWEWQDQDGGAGNRGILLLPSKKQKGWVHVSWKWIQNTNSHTYRIGAEGKYDLIYADNIDIRLAGGNDTAGRVEILYNGQWGTICDDQWDILDAEVVCRQLDLGPPLASTKKAFPFGKGTGSILLDNVACNGNELNIVQCRHHGFKVHNCNHNEDAGVVCLGKVVKEENLVLGKEVMRGGPDWNGQYQHGVGPGKLGILLSSRDGWVQVKWGWRNWWGKYGWDPVEVNERYSYIQSYSHRYRIGAEGKYDLIYAGRQAGTKGLNPFIVRHQEIENQFNLTKFIVMKWLAKIFQLESKKPTKCEQKMWHAKSLPFKRMTDAYKNRLSRVGFGPVRFWSVFKRNFTLAKISFTSGQQSSKTWGQTPETFKIVARHESQLVPVLCRGTKVVLKTVLAAGFTGPGQKKSWVIPCSKQGVYACYGLEITKVASNRPIHQTKISINDLKLYL